MTIARIKFLLSFLLLVPCTAISQLFPLGSQYLFDDYHLNPGITGSKVYNPVALLYKKQFAGMDDSPVIQSASYHALISGPPNHQTMGMGAGMQYNVFGPVSRMRLQLSYAYHAEIKRKTNKLAIGFALAALSQKLDKKKIIVFDPNDPLVEEAYSGAFEPNASFGLYFYSDRYGNQRYRYDTYNVGLSVSNVLGSPDSVSGTKFSLNSEDHARHYYLHGAYGHRAGSQLMFEPAVLIRFAEAGALQADMTLKAYFNYMETGNVWAGLTFRSGDALAFLFGLTHQNIAVGYSFDVVLSDISAYANSSHQVYLGILLNRRMIKTL